MRYIYFTDDTDFTILDSIWRWAVREYGLNFSIEGNNNNIKWKWIRAGDIKHSEARIIGIALPNEEAEILFKLMFPVRTHGSFTTIETVENGR